MRHINIISFIILLSVSISLSAGCSPAISTRQPTESVATLSPREIASPESAAIVPPTSSITPTDPFSSGGCLGSQQDLPKLLDGKFILAGDYDIYLPEPDVHNGTSYMLVPATGEKISLPKLEGYKIENYAVSPNRQMFAYYAIPINGGKNSVNWLILLDNSGNKISEFSDKTWWGLIGWLDNSHLLLSKYEKDLPLPTIIFDPFLNKQRELISDYPGIYSGQPLMLFWEQSSYTETVYSPDLHYVIYPKNPNQLILWDRDVNKALATIDDPGASSSIPLWSSIENTFIVDVSTRVDVNNPYYEEIISVGKDGEIKKLTDLVDVYGGADIRQLTESPDGRYIAFWFRPSVPPSGKFNLAVYDTKTTLTKVFCVNTITRVLTPIWSPDSHYLLAAGFLDSIENYGTVFVDVESNIFSEVEDGVIPAGWIVGP